MKFATHLLVCVTRAPASLTQSEHLVTSLSYLKFTSPHHTKINAFIIIHNVMSRFNAEGVWVYINDMQHTPWIHAVCETVYAAWLWRPVLSHLMGQHVIRGHSSREQTRVHLAIAGNKWSLCWIRSSIILFYKVTFIKLRYYY